MSTLMVQAWRCDRLGCGWVWYTGSETPPKRCAKCKSPAWNKGGNSPVSQTVAPLPKVAEVAAPELDEWPEDFPEESAPVLVPVDWYALALPVPARREDTQEDPREVLERLLARDERFRPQVREQQTEPLDAWAWRMHQRKRIAPEVIAGIEDLYYQYIPEG